MTRRTRKVDRRRVSAMEVDAPFAVVREPGDRPFVHERCAVCRNATRYWHAESNTPVCPACAVEIEHQPKREIVLREWSTEP